MKKSIFAIFFLVLMIVAGGVSVGFYLKSHSGAETAGSDVKVKDVPDCRDASLEYRPSVEHIKAGTEFYTNGNNPFSSAFRSIASWYDDLFPSPVAAAGGSYIVRLSNGYLTYLFPYSHPVESWNSQLDFVSWLKVRDTEYLALIAADKGDDSFGTFPEGLPLGYSRMAGEYKEFLDRNGIGHLDSKPVLLANNGDFYYWFYKADHHWNVHAGRLMAEETARRMNRMQLAADTCAAKIENFSLQVYPKGFLGSMGRKLGPKYKEDMEIYYPERETRFHIVIPSLGIDRTGDFANTLIERRDLPAYGALMHADRPLIQVENLLSDNETRALVIKQSKAEVFNPYFAMTVRYLDVIDPRFFEGSIRSFIERTNPDIVITCVDIPWEGDENFWRLK